MNLHDLMKESESRRNVLRDKVQQLKFDLCDAERILRYEEDHLDGLTESWFRKEHLKAGGFKT